jgi:adenine-specific DNA-methyltransferase
VVAARIARQREIDASIAVKAEFEYLYDKPYPDNSRIRVAGPFTVESLSPHRVMMVGEDENLIDPLDLAEKGAEWAEGSPDFARMVLENLRTAGVQQAHKEDRIRLYIACTLARRIDLCRRALHGRRSGATCCDFPRP